MPNLNGLNVQQDRPGLWLLATFLDSIGSLDFILLLLNNNFIYVYGSIALVPVTFDTFFQIFKSKNCPFLAKLEMFRGGFHHLLHLPPTNPSEFK